MPVDESILAAKRELSGQLLPKCAAEGVAGRRGAVTVAAAVGAADRNVHAVGVGRKVVAGQPTDQLCVRLYVVQKLPRGLLPHAVLLPSDVAGIPTDVIESAPAFAASAPPPCSADRTKRQRPVVPGISAAHKNVTAGTIACFCRSTLEGDDPERVCVLSNNHVFANVDNAAIGDELLQPGPADGGEASDVFATLARAAPIRVDGRSPNQVDAAIGRLATGVDVVAAVCSIGQVSGVAAADEDMRVCKHGRTTGYREGVVTDVALDAVVGMDPNDPWAAAVFVDQIRVDRVPDYPDVGLGGDSGSLLVDCASRAAVGLYFAGPWDGTYGLANHMADVCAALEIALL